MIQTKIQVLRSQHKDYADSGRIQEFNFKVNYLCAKRDGKIEAFRENEIAKRVASMYTLDQQIAILLDGNEIAVNNLKGFRAQVTTEVDILISQIDYEFALC